MIIRIRDIKIAGGIHDNALRRTKPGFNRRASIAAVTVISTSGYGSDDTGCIHLSDAAIRSVCNVKVAGSIYGNARRPTKPGFSRRPSVTAVASSSISGHGGDDAAGIHLPDTKTVAKRLS